MINFYKDLETIPFWNFHQITKTNDFKFLVKSESYDEKIKFDKKQAALIWQGIDDEFMSEFGITDQFISYMETVSMIIVYRSRYQRTKESIWNSYLTEEEMKLESFKTEYSQSLHEKVVNLEMSIGYQIDERKISAKKFFTYIKELNKQSKRNGEEAKKGRGLR